MSVALTVAGIVAPSLLLVGALRRWIAEVPWRMAMLFLLLTLAFLGGAVFTTKLPVPVDEVARGYPYRGLFGDVRARNPLTNDTAKLFLPWMQVAREELAHGRAPLWNRYAFSGYPLLANGESAPFAPFFLATLFVPLPKQIVAMAGLKIFASLLFGFLLIKREGVSDAAAAFGASAFAFSVFQTVFLFYSTTAVTALAPAALFSLFYAMDIAAKRGVVLVAIVVGSLMASGHPESVLHIAIAAAVLFAIDLALSPTRSDWVARFRYPLIGSLAGLLISLPAWLPVAEQVPLSTRFAELRAVPHEPPFPWAAAWALVAPNGFGNPVRHNWSWIRNYSSVATSYVGLLVLGSFIAALFSRRLNLRYRLWGAASVAMFLVAMQWTVVGRVVGALPLLSISANDKLRFVACLLIAAVAAKWVDGAPHAGMFTVTALPLGACALYAWSQHRAIGRPADLIGVAAVVAFLVVLAVPRFRRRAPAAALALCVLELFVLNVPFNALVSAKYFRPRLPIVEAIRARASGQPFRIVGFDWTFLPNAAAQYQLEDVRGSDPMSFRSYTEFLRLIAEQEPGTDVLRVRDVNHAAIDFLNVRFLVADPGAEFAGKWKEAYRGNDGVLYENSRVLPRFFVPLNLKRAEGPALAEVASIDDYAQEAFVSGAAAPAAGTNPAGVTVVETSRGRTAGFALRIHTPARAVIASSEPMSRWWRVRVNGRSVRLFVINTAFLGFSVDAGDSRVTVEYVPLAYYGSVVVAMAGIAGLVFLPRRKRAPRSPKLVE